MKRYLPLSTIAGIVGVIGYVLWALLAYRRYPGAYSPLRNWLSDLGSPRQNPQGALF